jgi:hypothetical protein
LFIAIGLLLKLGRGQALLRELESLRHVCLWAGICLEPGHGIARALQLALVLRELVKARISPVEGGHTVC